MILGNETKIVEIIKRNPEKVDFIFEQVAIYFNELTQAISILRNKAVLLIGFLFAVIAFSMPQIINGISNPVDTPYVCFFLYISVVYCLIAIYLAHTTFKTRKFCIAGAEPKAIFDENYIEADIGIIKIGECKEYQKKIDTNMLIMNDVSRALNFSLNATIISALIGLAIQYFILFLNN